MIKIGKPDDIYKMNYQKPGKVYVFANSKFSKVELTDFPRMVKDILKIEEVFENLQYDVERFLDKSSQEIKKILKEISKKDYSNDSCVIVFINSHGDFDSIYGTDSEKILVREFFETFKKIDSLKEKPKLFFVDACRGDSILKKESKNFSDAVNGSSVDEESDIFIGYATVQGKVSQIDVDGSKFIQELCSIIEKDEYNTEIDSIIRKINRNIAKTEKQVADVNHSLRKSFYFRNPFNESKKSSSEPHICSEKIPDGPRALKNASKIEIWKHISGKKVSK